jgi:haloacetate dehalogenase
MFEGFQAHDIPTNGTTLRCRVAGQGPALLLLHGHPQSHVMWHRVAPALTAHFTVICADLRGYGDSKRHAADTDHVAHTKRTMAADLVGLMTHFGFETFRIAAHDRGARVAHRLALDYPNYVSQLLFLDIAPTLAMYEHTSDAFARAYWHWYFLIQPAPLPERLIEADPVAYIRDVMGRRHAGLAAFAPEAWAEYARCIALPGTATAICEDYRASATTDLVHDRADRLAGNRIRAPLRVLWGSQGAVGRCFDVLPLWQSVATDVSGRSLDCGHYIAEESPEALLEEMVAFFQTH